MIDSWEELWRGLSKALLRKRNQTQEEKVMPAAPAAPAPITKNDDSKYKDVKFVREGQKVIIPLDMSWEELMIWADRRRSEDERQVTVHHELPYFPIDGAVAFQRALSDIYGWADLVPTPGFFGPNPPHMVGIKVSLTERIQVPWGRIQVQGIDGYLETGMIAEPVPRFTISGLVKNKNLPQVEAIVGRTERFLKEQSIYKAKAIKISFEWQRLRQNFDFNLNCPQFIPLAGVQEDDLIFGKEVQTALDIGLFTPIKYAKAMRQFQVPLKRGVLLHGPYGTGKTLTANVTAMKAIANGFTFIYLHSVLDLKKGLEFAAQYGPSVLFVEDIDRALSGERTIGMDEILNCLDGVDTKGNECIAVFTTNKLEDIDPAMLRMGRLDSLIEVKPPDSEAAQRLVRLYGRGLLVPTTDYEKIGTALQGKIPAYIREVVERAKIAAIKRLDGADITGKVLQEDLLSAATAMENHAALLTPRKKNAGPKPEILLRVPRDYTGDVSEIMESLGVGEEVGNGVSH